MSGGADAPRISGNRILLNGQYIIVSAACVALKFSNIFKDEKAFFGVGGGLQQWRAVAEGSPRSAAQ